MYKIKKKKRKIKRTKREIFDCDKIWWVSRTNTEKQKIKIFSEQLNDLFPNLVVRKGGSGLGVGPPLA